MTRAAPPFCLGRFAGSEGAFTGVVVGDAVARLSAVRDDLDDGLAPVAVLERWESLADAARRRSRADRRWRPRRAPVASLRRLPPVEPRSSSPQG